MKTLTRRLARRLTRPMFLGHMSVVLCFAPLAVTGANPLAMVAVVGNLFAAVIVLLS